MKAHVKGFQRMFAHAALSTRGHPKTNFLFGSISVTVLLGVMPSLLRADAYYYGAGLYTNPNSWTDATGAHGVPGATDTVSFANANNPTVMPAGAVAVLVGGVTFGGGSLTAGQVQGGVTLNGSSLTVQKQADWARALCS